MLKKRGCGPSDENLWGIEARIDLSRDPSPKAPLLRLLQIGP